MILSISAQKAARAALAWDVARIAAACGRKQRVIGPNGIRISRPVDAFEYQARQARAEAAITSDVATWPQEVRLMYQVVLEVLGGGSGFALGAGRVDVPIPSAEDLAGYRQFAAEIGVLDALREVSPQTWGVRHVGS